MQHSPPARALLKHIRKRPGHWCVFAGPQNRTDSLANPEPKDPPSNKPHRTRGTPLPSSEVVRWLGYWFTRALSSTPHFSHRLSLALAIFSFVKRLSTPGAGIRSFLCHRIATGLLCPILTYEPTASPLHTLRSEA